MLGFVDRLDAQMRGREVWLKGERFVRRLEGTGQVGAGSLFRALARILRRPDHRAETLRDRVAERGRVAAGRREHGREP